MITPLSFPPTELELKRHGSKLKVLCLIRKKWIILTPEEWVRQHVVQYLMTEKNYPQSLLNVEKVLQPEDFAELIVASLKLPRRAMMVNASLWSTNP